MTYLSRILLNPLRRQTQALMRNPQRLHAAVLGGVVPPVDERVLWRPEIRQHAVELLVQTASMPSWEHLVEQAGWAGSDQGQPLVRDLRPLLDQVVVGREFGFKIRANPSSMVRAPQKPSASQLSRAEDKRRGMRVGHRTAGTQLAWFVGRTTQENHPWGFTTAFDGEANVTVVGREHLSFNKSHDGKGQRVSLDVATYQGVLRIVDAESARAALLAGIGRGKGYGCGLLTLAPRSA